MGSHKKHRKESPSDEDDRSDEDKKKKKKRKHQKSKRKRKQESSSSATSSESSSESTDTEKKQRKILKKKKKIKRLEKEKKAAESTDIPIELMEKSKAMAPMTKEEWEKRQSVVKKVFDETTGRHRLVKGDGEVIEEMVSRDRHKAINQQATRGDGKFFQSQVYGNLKK